MFANTVGVALEDVLHVGGNFLKHDIDSANTYTNTESIKKNVISVLTLGHVACTEVETL